MGDSEKLMALKKAYAEIILNTAKEAAARVMVAERRAFRYQRELGDAKEDAVRMMVRLKHMMDSRIFEADIVASRQQSKIEELEAQLQEAEDIVKDLREELSIVRDELDDTKRNLSQQVSEQQANYVVIRGQEEQGEEAAPSVSDNNRVLNIQAEHATTSELGNLSDQRISESVRDGHCETLFVYNVNLAPNVIPVKELELLRSGSHQRIHALGCEDLSNNGGLHGKSHILEDESIVREDCEDSIKSVTPNSSAELCVSERKSRTWMKQVNKSNTGIYLAMKRRAHNLRFKKGYASSSLRKRKSLAKQVLKSLKKTNLVTLKTSPTSVIQSEVVSSAPRESKGQKDLGLSSHTTELCPNTRLCGPIRPCSQSTPENDKSNKDKASTGEENGSAESSITCVDAEVACAPSCSIVEESDELAIDDALQPKNDRSIKYTFQRKRKKDCMDNADENGVVKIVKRVSDRESMVKPTNMDSDATGLLTRSSHQSDDKKDTLKEFKRPLKKMNVDKQEFKRSMKPVDVEMPTDTKPKAIGIVPKASRDSRRLAQVARQLVSMSEKKWRN